MPYEESDEWTLHVVVCRECGTIVPYHKTPFSSHHKDMSCADCSTGKYIQLTIPIRGYRGMYSDNNMRFYIENFFHSRKDQPLLGTDRGEIRSRYNAFRNKVLVNEYFVDYNDITYWVNEDGKYT